MMILRPSWKIKLIPSDDCNMSPHSVREFRAGSVAVRIRTEPKRTAKWVPEQRQPSWIF